MTLRHDHHCQTCSQIDRDLETATTHLANLSDGEKLELLRDDAMLQWVHWYLGVHPPPHDQEQLLQRCYALAKLNSNICSIHEDW